MSAALSNKAAAPLSPQACEELARRVLGMVTGSQAQVEIASSHSSSNSFARGNVRMASENAGLSVQLMVEAQGRHARGSTNQVDGEGLRALVAEVEALTRESRSPQNWEVLPPQTYPKAPQIFFDATLGAMGAEVQADLCRRAADAAESAGLVASGDLRLSTSARAVLNTQGLWAYTRKTYGEFSMTARTNDGTGSGWAWGGYEDWSRVNVQAIIARAVDLAQRSTHPKAVEPGRYTVILEPAAVAALIHPIIGVPTASWAAEAADAGSTVFSKEPLGTNKIGLQMIDRRLGMISNPWDPERPASTISGGWRPLSPVPWFEQGVLRTLAYDPAYARQKGREPVFGPGGVRLTVEGSTQTLDELIASTRRGIWVNRLSHVNTMSNQTLLLTGTTRDGTFLIENGKITKPIKNFRFTESPFFVFNRLEACSEPVRASPLVVAPRLKLRDFNFSSLSDAV